MKLLLVVATSGLLCAQVIPNPTQRGVQGQSGDVPVFKVNVVARTMKAVNYRHRSGSTKVDFRGTALMPDGKGDAKVESERGVIKISANFSGMRPASTYGPEYLTYVLWAISPEGRPVNMGELTLSDYGNGAKSAINTTSDLQAFGMIVTAEPYYSVTQPSDVVVMENFVRADTLGQVEEVDAKFELLPRGQYTLNAGSRFRPVLVSKKQPLELYEAENAIQLATIAGADKYAADSLQKAQERLQQANRYQIQKAGQKPAIMIAREAAQQAEDARLIALRRAQEDALAQERQAASDREAAERAKAEQAARQQAMAEQQARDEAARRAQADAERMAAERAKTEAQAAAADAARMKAEADAARAQADQARAQAEAARQAALAQQQALAVEADKARQAAADANAARAQADALRMKAEQDQAQLRQQLLTQLNMILETRDSARGLIVNMADVLFDTGKYTLRPITREKLAKVAGIVLAHPGLMLEVEGHTDSVGGDEYNMKLSEQRAGAVRDYLVAQGIASGNVTAKGFGKTMPVADNSTAAGRQQNRRVEMVVSGDVIGTKLTSMRDQQQQSTMPAATVQPH